MRTVQRLGAIALAGLVMTAVLALPASAQTEVQVRPESFIATASARGLELSLFGTTVTVGQSSAVINSGPSAEASGAGVTLASGTVSTSKVTGPNESAAPPKACVLNLPVLQLLTVELACGESRVDTNNAAPQAFGHGAVAGIDLAALNILDPVIELLRSLLNQLLPVVDQTVGSVLNALPAVGPLVGSLAGSLGLGTTSSVTPVTSLVNNLLDGVKRATGLLT